MIVALLHRPQAQCLTLALAKIGGRVS